jgi:hypothetical protein
VAEYRGQLTPKDFGNMLVTVATEYNDALLVIENASVGFGAIQSAIDREYKNLYYTYKQDGVVDATTQLTKGYDLKDKSQMTPGFTTSSKTRPLLISKLDIYLREKECIIRSKRLLEELRVFIWNGSKAMWVRDTALKLKQQGIELDRMAISRIGKNNQHGVYTNSNIESNPWKQKTRNGQDEDLTWLL